MVDVTGAVVDYLPLPQFEGEWQISIPYKFRDMEIVIEYLAGDRRTKTKDGITYSGVMPAAYGFIRWTTDQHGEEIDMYLSPMVDAAADVYVVDQVCPGTGLFDEHKVMLGFPSLEEAIATYLDVFNDGTGSKRMGAITTFPGDTFKRWFSIGGNTLLPAMKCDYPEIKIKAGAGIAIPRPSPNFRRKEIDEVGGVKITLPDLSQGPKMETQVDETGAFHYTLNLFSAIETETWSNLFDAFCRTLDLANEQDVVHIRIASPGGSVFLMGRVASAIRRTKAKVITYAQGSVASAATTIWAAGHERHILPGAFFMQHMSSQFMAGKTSDIAAKTTFCMEYISKHLQPLITIGLFTPQEVDDMIVKSADIFIPGREAVRRCGAVSTTA